MDVTRTAHEPGARPGTGGHVPVAIAIDGGNSKTEVLVVRADGQVIARARGGGFRPQLDGIDSAMAVLSTIVSSVAHEQVDLVAAYLAGADLPEEEVELNERLVTAGWGRRVVLGNDTLALLRCGAPERWGVAVVCGAGINALGVARDGTVARFPALGELTGDWGGGDGLARAALWSAVRGEDGRGPRTALSDAIAEEFGSPSALDVGLSVHRARLSWRHLAAITPLLFRVAAGGDEVASSIVERLAAEVAALAAVLVRRLGLDGVEVPLVLGGGVLRARHPQFGAALERQIAEHSLHVSCRVPQQTPVYGAALLAIEDLGADADAGARLLAQAELPSSHPE